MCCRVLSHSLPEIEEDEHRLLILVVDDEPDVEVLFRQRFRHDLRAGRFPWSLPNPVQLRFSASAMRPGCLSSYPLRYQHAGNQRP